MSQFILIDHIKVQNANAVAGFTWGFPAITNFLGFVHNLSRKLCQEKNYSNIFLKGCAVVAHDHKIHTYWSKKDGLRFVQSRNPPYLHGIGAANKSEPPPVIEEGKMNMSVSLLIQYDGNIGNRVDAFRQKLKNICLLQRLAGGTIFDIANITFYTSQDDHDVRLITRRLLPGFVLQDRTKYLEAHYKNLMKNAPDSELLDAWLDFSMLKQIARPKSDLISDHMKKIFKNDPNNQQGASLLAAWQNHLGRSYDVKNIPEELKTYFVQLEDNKANKNLLKQWKSYCEPDEKTDADWEYVPKPKPGYLVPIMIGYKAISPVYKNADVGNTRDNETDVCFVESVHSIGEWQSVHRIKNKEQLQSCLWDYYYKENWYLCRQQVDSQTDTTDTGIEPYESVEEDIYS